MKLSSVGAASSAFGIWTGSALKNLNLPSLPDFHPEQFLTYAKNCGLGGIELPPLRFLKSDGVKTLVAEASKKGQFLFFDCDKAAFEEQLTVLAPFVQQTQSRTLRIKTSDVLGCERFKMDRPWREHVNSLSFRLKKVVPLLNDFNIRIAIENHQDLDSDDLLRILEEAGSDCIGINWDIGNSMATLEDPLAFAKRFDEKIFNAHIKDYCLVPNEAGYGLARCAIGAGVVDFPSVLKYLNQKAPLCYFAIELGAHPVRWIKYKEPQFFHHFEKRTLESCKSYLERIHGMDWKSQSESKIFNQLSNGTITLEEAITLEKKEFSASVAYLAGIL